MAVSFVCIARSTLGGYLVSGHHGDRAGGGQATVRGVQSVFCIVEKSG